MEIYANSTCMQVAKFKSLFCKKNLFQHLVVCLIHALYVRYTPHVPVAVVRGMGDERRDEGGEILQTVKKRNILGSPEKKKLDY